MIAIVKSRKKEHITAKYDQLSWIKSIRQNKTIEIFIPPKWLFLLNLYFERRPAHYTHYPALNHEVHLTRYQNWVAVKIINLGYLCLIRLQSKVQHYVNSAFYVNSSMTVVHYGTIIIKVINTVVNTNCSQDILIVQLINNHYSSSNRPLFQQLQNTLQVEYHFHRCQ